MAKKYPKLRDPAWLKEAYKTKVLREIAEEIGCATSSVFVALERNGIARRKIGRPCPDQRLHNKDWMTLKTNLTSCAQIAKELGVSNKSVYRACEAMGIKLARGCKPRHVTMNA